MKENQESTETQTEQGPQPEKEYKTRGKFGEGQILKHPSGKREVLLRFWNGKTLRAESQKVDLEGKTLKDAINFACHKTGFLPLFEKLEISGPKALVVCYRRPNQPNQGYASIIKKGVTPLKFSLSRIDLRSMKSRTCEEALRKTAHQTGAIKLIETKKQES